MDGLASSSRDGGSYGVGGGENTLAEDFKVGGEEGGDRCGCSKGEREGKRREMARVVLL
jgi:hypothetical protein